MAPLKALNKFFWKYKWLLLLGFFFVLLTNFFRILAPQITGFVVNSVVGSMRHHPAEVALPEGVSGSILLPFMQMDFQSKILYCGLILIGLAIISGFFMFLMRQTIIVMSRHIEFDQKNQIYAHYQQLDISFYKQHATGDLMSRISEDVSRVRMYTGPALMYFVNLAAVIGFSLYFMFRSDARMSLLVLSPMPVLALVIYWVNAIINKKSERIQSQLSDLTANAQESYSGIRVVKSYVQELSMIRYFRNASDDYRSSAIALSKTEALYFPSMGLLIGLSTLITVMIGALDVVHGVPGASVGKIAEFVLYIQMLTFPVSAIGWTASMTQRAAASQRRINEFLDTKPAIIDAAAAITPALKGSIKWENVDFTYKNTGIHAINRLQLHIQPGEKIAIVGRTGSGKSTIAQLLLRLYEPDSGQILFDQFPASQIQLGYLRSSIAYVPQDHLLFSDTIAANIRFGRTDATDEEVQQAAIWAGIHDEISRLPAGYQTLIGERGITLSGGQKQRISIARALLKNASILILDDCLSAVDTLTEQHILKHLSDVLTTKTAIIITHRVTSTVHVDRIVVLEAGSIVALGTHEELLQNSNVYRDMFEMQRSREGE